MPTDPARPLSQSSLTLPRGVAWTATLLIATSALYQLILAPPDGSNRIGCMLGALGVLVAVFLWALIPIGRAKARYGIGILLLVAMLIGEAVLLKFFHHFSDGAGGQINLLPLWGDLGATVIGSLSFFVAACAVAGVVLRGANHWRAATAVITLAVLVYVGTALAMFRQFPTSGIDVTTFHRDSTAALLHGENPYAITFPNVYSHDGAPSPYYSQEVQRDGRVLFGYPYPPLCLLIMTAGRALSADPRVTLSLCFGLAAFITAFISPGRLSILAAAFMLIAPGAMVVQNLSWTEPQSLLLLAIVAWAAVRNSKTLPIWLGLFFALKQYNVIFAPLLFLLLPRPLTLRSAARFLTPIVLTALIVTVPLALWDAKAFWHSTVYIQLIQPFRYDSFSLLAAYARSLPTGTPPPSGAWAFLLLIPTLALLLWRLQRNIAGFTLGVAVTMIVFLMFNRQAFLNYHTFAADALLIAAATYEGVFLVPSPVSTRERELTPPRVPRAALPGPESAAPLATAGRQPAIGTRTSSATAAQAYSRSFPAPCRCALSSPPQTAPAPGGSVLRCSHNFRACVAATTS